MSLALIRIWLKETFADQLSPEKEEEFIRRAQRDMEGKRVYVPMRRDANHEQLANMQRCRDEGMSDRRIAEMFDMSPSTVAARLSKIPPYKLDSEPSIVASSE